VYFKHLWGEGSVIYSKEKQNINGCDDFSQYHQLIHVNERNDVCLSHWFEIQYMSDSMIIVLICNGNWH